MSISVAARPRPLRASLAAALVVGLVALVAALLAPAPAEAARAARLTTSYTCSVPGMGSASSPVTIGTTLPSSVKAGKRLGARSVRATITVPQAMVTLMRRYGVRTVKGSATGASYRVGARTARISNMSIPATRVPTSGALRITGTGRAAAVRLAKPGRYTVQVPVSFKARVTAVLASGQSISATMSCRVSPGARTALGTVVAR